MNTGAGFNQSKLFYVIDGWVYTMNPEDDAPLSPIAMQRATMAIVLLQSAKQRRTSPSAPPRWPTVVKNLRQKVLLNLPQAIILSHKNPQDTDTIAWSRNGREDRKPFLK